LPALTVGGYRISLAPSNERLYVTAGRRYLGEITEDGKFRMSKDWATFSAPRYLTYFTSVEALVEKTVQVVQAIAAIRPDPKCPICNQLLNPRDRKRGFGPACWEKGLFNTYERRAIAAEQRRVRIDRRGRGVRKSKPRKRRH
jgi:hypothetical protein